MNSHQASSCFSTFSTFHLGEAPPNSLRGLGGNPVNPPVEEDHDHHGSKERSNGAVEDIAGVARQDALGRALGGQHEPAVEVQLAPHPVTAPTNQRREADNEADDPNKTYQHFGPAVRKCNNGPEPAQHLKSSTLSLSIHLSFDAIQESKR